VVTIRRLDRLDKREAFVSEDSRLDEFFQRFARQHQDRHLSTTYVAVIDPIAPPTEIFGFITVVSAEVEPAALSAADRRKLPQSRVPVLRLARMAAAKTLGGKGIGKALVKHVFKLALEQELRVGCIGVVVDAKPGRESYYAQFGFQPLAVVAGSLPDQPTPMFLPIGSIPPELANT
jgi:GNAT superfamily N-acetyltransferase